MTETIENRREFFRINDTLELQASPLTLPEDMTEESLHRQRCVACDEANKKPSDRLERPAILSLVGRRHPEVLAYIKEMEKRLANAIIKVDDTSFGTTPIYRQLVNISGNGIRFSMPAEFPVGTLIELILRLENGFRFVVFARVVRSERAESTGDETMWNTAATFVQIRDDDQDELIRYLLARQAESVRVASI